MNKPPYSRSDGIPSSNVRVPDPLVPIVRDLVKLFRDSMRIYRNEGVQWERARALKEIQKAAELQAAINEATASLDFGLEDEDDDDDEPAKDDG